MSRRAQVLTMLGDFVSKPKRGKRLDKAEATLRLANALDWDAVDDQGHNPERLKALIEAAAKRAFA